MNIKLNSNILMPALAATALLVGCSAPPSDSGTNTTPDKTTTSSTTTPASDTSTKTSDNSGMMDDHMSMDSAKDMPMDNGAKSSDTSPADAPMVDKDGNKVVAFTNSDGKLVCPVMGSVIPDAKDAVGYQDYKGKRYYFCCDGCPQSFKADPAKYADGAFLAKKDKK